MREEHASYRCARQASVGMTLVGVDAGRARPPQLAVADAAPIMGGRSTTPNTARGGKPRVDGKRPRRLGIRSRAGNAGSARPDGRRGDADGTEDSRLRVRRFDADRTDRVLTFDEALASRPTERQLLWIDVVGELAPDDMDRLGRRFKLDDQTRRALTRPIEQPHVAVHGGYVHLSLRAHTPEGEGPDRTWLDVIGGRNVVITRHAEELELLDDIDERIKSDAPLGAAEGLEFVAMILEGVLTTYFQAVDTVEDQIDRLDTRSLRDDGRHQLLDDLVHLRHRIARLRRTVTDHRTVFAALSGPEIRQIVRSPDAAADLQSAASRYEAAVGAVEASREALLGSFDVYMTRTAQRTNDVMKILTIATVLLLPGSVVAGFLGMNVIVPLDKDNPLSFWLVVLAVGLLAVVVLGAARWKRWI
jgi:Mg2+ and Co2+ transporter CorA